MKLAREDPDKYAEAMEKMHKGMAKLMHSQGGTWDDPGASFATEVTGGK